MIGAIGQGAQWAMEIGTCGPNVKRGCCFPPRIVIFAGGRFRDRDARSECVAERA